MMNGYLLTIAVLVVSAGRLGDMFGRKRVFLFGMVLFALGSVLSGAAGGPEMLIGGRVLQGAGRGADALALPRPRLQRLPGRPAAAGARDLGRGLGRGAGDRPACRRPPDRTRLAADLLDQPADLGARHRDHGDRRAGVDRPRVGAADRLAGARRALGRPHRDDPRPRAVARLGRRGVARAGARSAARPRRLLADRAPGEGADRRLRAVPQRPLLRRQRRRLLPWSAPTGR